MAAMGVNRCPVGYDQWSAVVANQVTRARSGALRFASAGRSLQICIFLIPHTVPHQIIDNI